jgi:predicted AlkP superfamily phosphohydrolase/phosphomutase
MNNPLKFFIMSDYILEAWRVRDEHFIQGTALKKIMGDLRSNELELALIQKFGRDFRSIIDDFKKRFKALPTPDDLIWIAGVYNKKDPRLIAQELAIELSKGK